MRLRWPWASREHRHSGYVSQAENLMRYEVCSRCGHLLLSGYVTVWRVAIDCQGVTGTMVYGRSCAPAYDKLVLGLDGKWTKWLRTETGYEAMGEAFCPEGWEHWEDLALKRLALDLPR